MPNFVTGKSRASILESARWLGLGWMRNKSGCEQELSLAGL